MLLQDIKYLYFLKHPNLFYYLSKIKDICFDGLSQNPLITAFNVMVSVYIYYTSCKKHPRSVHRFVVLLQMSILLMVCI